MLHHSATRLLRGSHLYLSCIYSLALLPHLLLSRSLYIELDMQLDELYIQQIAGYLSLYAVSISISFFSFPFWEVRKELQRDRYSYS